MNMKDDRIKLFRVETLEQRVAILEETIS